jgi:peptide-methionine (S)-S-oxide reductase
MENVTQEHATQEKTTLEKATFGAGCFWGVEAAFRQIKGVVSTAVGFSGGNYDNPSYHDVCTGRTGHAEVVEVTYDPARVSYEDLLKCLTQSIHSASIRA